MRKKPFFLQPLWWNSIRTRVRVIVRDCAIIEVVQRLGLACLLWTALAGLAAVGPALARYCYVRIANVLFPLIVAGAVVWLLFGVLLAPFIGKEGKERFRAWSVEVCLRSAWWFARKVLLSLVYTTLFVLRLAVAPFWPGKVADQVRVAGRGYTARMRSIVGLLGA